MRHLAIITTALLVGACTNNISVNCNVSGTCNPSLDIRDSGNGNSSGGGGEEQLTDEERLQRELAVGNIPGNVDPENPTLLTFTDMDGTSHFLRWSDAVNPHWSAGGGKIRYEGEVDIESSGILNLPDKGIATADVDLMEYEFDFNVMSMGLNEDLPFIYYRGVDLDRLDKISHYDISVTPKTRAATEHTFDHFEFCSNAKGPPCFESVVKYRNWFEEDGDKMGVYFAETLSRNNEKLYITTTGVIGRAANQGETQ